MAFIVKKYEQTFKYAANSPFLKDFIEKKTISVLYFVRLNGVRDTGMPD